jgi:protease I
VIYNPNSNYKYKIMEKRIAILATNGFEEVELSSPKEYLEQQGWKAEIVSLKVEP